MFGGETTVLTLYAGEEQGLLSSSYYAQKLRSAGEDVLMMLQVDMVGYRKPGEPMQLARPDLIGLEEAGWFVGNVSGLYAPELVVGYDVLPQPLLSSGSRVPVSSDILPLWLGLLHVQLHTGLLFRPPIVCRTGLPSHLDL